MKKKTEPSKEFKELFAEMAKSSTNVDTRASKRRIEYYINKIQKDARIDQSRTDIHFTI